MAKNDVKVGDNPKLLKKKMSDGNYSLYLDYYLGRVDVKDPETGEIKSKVQRKREFLKLTILSNPRTPIEREENKKTLELASGIRDKREKEVKGETLGYVFKKKINFLDYFQTYLDDYTKADIRMIRIAFQRFKDFLNDTPEYNIYSNNIKPEQLNKDMMLDFTDYLKSRSVGEGAKTIYARFKKVINYAIEHNVIINNPCKGVSIKTDEQALREYSRNCV